MTELDKIKRAKMYVDKLSNGINPLDDTIVPETDVVNNVRISRCLFFISDVLRQVIENGGTTPQPAFNKPDKLPFYLPPEKRSAFVFSEVPIPASELARRLTDLANCENRKKLTYSSIATWLIEAGRLTYAVSPSGKETKRPTQEGVQIGIAVEERMGANGPYHVVTYNTEAQRFILDNLDGIIQFEAAKTEMQGKPWTQAHDECLKDLHRKGLSPKAIAATLKRSTKEVRARLKNLGLMQI